MTDTLSKNMVVYTKNAYKFFNTKKKYKSIKCGVIILNKTLDRVILVKNNIIKNENKWGLPKGHLDNNETYAECARREALEESGIKVCIKDSQAKIKINNSFYYPVIIDEDHLKNLEPKDKKEICKVSWFDIKKINELNKNRDLKIICSRYWSRIKYIAKLEKFNNCFSFYCK